MNKSENQLFSQCIEALVTVQDNLLDMSAARLIQRSMSKKPDSLFLDTTPEITLSKKLIEEYNSEFVLITEEKGIFNTDQIASSQIVVFADPTDRSKQLKEFIELQLQTESKPDCSFGDLMSNMNAIEEWNHIHKTPAELSGACCSITIVKNRTILFTMCLNYITKEIYLAYDDGAFRIPTIRLSKTEGEYQVDDKWTTINFYPPEERKTFVTFLGKQSYEGYLKSAKPFDQTYKPLEKEPGGPLRILYLSNLNPQPPAFILANGEKIAEWLGWLAFVKASNDLVAYAIYPEAVFTRDNILLAPSPLYSILECKEDTVRLDFDKLKYYKNPSRYREMILVAHRHNTWITAEIEADRSRKLYP